MSGKTKLQLRNTMGFVSASKLAKVIDKPKDQIVEAVHEREKCSGYPVWKWAEQGKEGQVYGFEVPQELLRELADERQKSNGLFGG